MVLMWKWNYLNQTRDGAEKSCESIYFAISVITDVLDVGKRCNGYTSKNAGFAETELY